LTTPKISYSYCVTADIFALLGYCRALTLAPTNRGEELSGAV
jgi:hypothetical protein